MRDLYSNIGAARAISPAVHTAAATGQIIDLQAVNGVTFLVTTGAIAGAGDFGLVVQDSDTTTPGDFVNVAAGLFSSDAPATLAADSAYRIGYAGFKRYVRLNLTRAGGTSIAAGAVAVTHPLDRP